MIREVLIPRLATRFADRDFQPGGKTKAIGIFPAVNKQVGDLAIFDDGDLISRSLKMSVVSGLLRRLACSSINKSKTLQASVMILWIAH